MKSSDQGDRTGHIIAPIYSACQTTPGGFVRNGHKHRVDMGADPKQREHLVSRACSSTLTTQEKNACRLNRDSVHMYDAQNRYTRALSIDEQCHARSADLRLR